MPRVNLTSGQKVGVMSMVIIAALTTFIDFVFHLVATFPMEITTYFVAIFLFSLVGAALIPEYGIFAGAFVFTALKTVYNVLAVYLSVPNLTVLTSSGTISIFGWGPMVSQFTSPITLAYGALWFILHGIFFLIAAIIVLGARK